MRCSEREAESGVHRGAVRFAVLQNLIKHTRSSPHTILQCEAPMRYLDAAIRSERLGNAGGATAKHVLTCSSIIQRFSLLERNDPH